MDEMKKYPINAMKTQKDSLWKNDLIPGTDDEDSSDGDDAGEDESGEILGSIKRSGEYLHLGLENALMGKSPGLYYYADHIAMLRRLEAHSPGILPMHFLKLAFGKELATAEGLLEVGHELPRAFFWFDKNLRRPELLLFSLNLHADGVQVYDNAEKAEVMPLLASIHEIVPFSPTIETRPNFRKGESFVKSLFLSLFVMVRFCHFCELIPSFFGIRGTHWLVSVNFWARGSAKISISTPFNF
jgi:hypothetical protein